MILGSRREPGRKVRVLIVDDSAVVRAALTNILNEASDIEVVGSAMDPVLAKDKIKRLEPDVITLDIEMPRMDGLSFLKALMQYRPIPVVMVSSLTKAGAEATLEALSAGAVDYVTKPATSSALHAMGEEIVEKVRAAAGARVRARAATHAPEPPIDVSEVVPIRAHHAGHATGNTVICIGASTGGTTAIEHILTRLPQNVPPIVIVQHMPAGFTRSFAERLNRLSKIEVVEGSDQMAVQPGRAIVAPGGFQMLLQRRPGGYKVDVKDAPPVNRHRPAVDVLFRSAVNAAGKDVVAVLLTGMGGDGARGLLELRQSGAVTAAQDEASSVVFGMPKVAIELGAAEEVLPLNQVAGWLVKAAGRAG